MLSSTTDTDPVNFTSVEESFTGSDSWKEIKVTLPAGSKYFAIRCISCATFGLIIDDITYTTIQKGTDKKVIGYNIYVDGEFKQKVDAIRTIY